MKPPGKNKPVTVAIDPTYKDPYFPWGISFRPCGNEAHSEAVLDALAYRDSAHYKTLAFKWVGPVPEIGSESLARRIQLECQRQPERLR